MGFFSRNEAGQIFVGGESHFGFAARGRDRIYSLWKDNQGVSTLSYSIPSKAIAFRVHWEKGPSDLQAAGADALDVGYDWASALLIGTGFPIAMAGGAVLEGISFLKDLGPGLEGATRVASYGESGHYRSEDVLNATGMLPWLGSGPDAFSCILNLTGWRFDVTP